MFDNLHITKIEGDDDTIGGNYSLFDSNLYDATIKVVYLDKAQNSESVAAHIIIDINNQELSDKVFITTKEGSNLDKNGKPLKGYNLINSLCQLVTGSKGDVKDFTECLARKKSKMIELYDYESKEKIPTSKIILPDLTDAKIVVAVLKVLTDKKKQENGVWIVDGSKEANVIDKFLTVKNHYTFTEATRDDDIDPNAISWKETWLQKNLNKIQDKTTKGSTSNSAVKTAGTKPTTTTKRTSLL
jgi:hypothetical protein